MGRGRSRADWRWLRNSRCNRQQDPQQAPSLPDSCARLAPHPRTSQCRRPPQCSPGGLGPPGWAGPAGVGPRAPVGHHRLWGGKQGWLGCPCDRKTPTLGASVSCAMEWGCGTKATQGLADTE